MTGSYQKLMTRLYGAPVSRIIEFDPELLFLDSLDHGENFDLLV